MTDDFLPELPGGAFAKQDESDDLTFYAPRRMATHIDPAAVEALTTFYQTLMKENDRELNLMSS